MRTKEGQADSRASKTLEAVVPGDLTDMDATGSATWCPGLLRGPIASSESNGLFCEFCPLFISLVVVCGNNTHLHMHTKACFRRVPVQRDGSIVSDSVHGLAN